MNCPKCNLFIDQAEKYCPNCGTDLSCTPIMPQASYTEPYQEPVREQKDSLLLKFGYMGISAICGGLLFIIALIVLIQTVIGIIVFAITLLQLIFFPIIVLLSFFGQPANVVLGIGFFLIFYVAAPICITALSRWRRILKDRVEEAGLIEDVIIGILASYIISWLVAILLLLMGVVPIPYSPL